jgi:hypothetical protein
MNRLLQQLARSQAGTSTIEFAIVAMLFLLLTFGLVDFGHMFWQYNSAAKAAQLGARLAAVSDPVWQILPTITDDGTPGGAWTTNYDVTCSGASAVCNGTSPDDTDYDATAMQCLVFGRNPSSPPCDTVCSEAGMDGENGICDRFSRITPANVSITYSHTNLGFSGRPGGPVPTITLRLTGLQFNFVALGALAGLQTVPMPDFVVTMTGEDLSRAAP